MKKELEIKTRSIERVVTPPAPHMVGNGFRVHGYIPNTPGLHMQRMDPFIVLDYNPAIDFSPSETPRGVGVHPHKGFETVTIAYKGSIAHHDSSGGGGIIGEGDVQWMTAGSGVLHKEYHEEKFSKAGGLFQMVQLWINLSAENKKQAAKYQAITADAIQKVALANNQGTIDLIAGEYQGSKGPASTFSPVHLSNARLVKGGKATFSFPSHYTTFMIVIEGRVKINATESVDTDHFILMKNDGEQFEIEATEDAVVLVASGEPIKEPIAAYGPFVMNTEEELMQAFHDFNTGKFGYLE